MQAVMSHSTYLVQFHILYYFITFHFDLQKWLLFADMLHFYLCLAFSDVVGVICTSGPLCIEEPHGPEVQTTLTNHLKSHSNYTFIYCKIILNSLLIMIKQFLVKN